MTAILCVKYYDNNGVLKTLVGSDRLEAELDENHEFKSVIGYKKKIYKSYGDKLVFGLSGMTGYSYGYGNKWLQGYDLTTILLMRVRSLKLKCSGMKCFLSLKSIINKMQDIGIQCNPSDDDNIPISLIMCDGSDIYEYYTCIKSKKYLKKKVFYGIGSGYYKIINDKRKLKYLPRNPFKDYKSAKVFLTKQLDYCCRTVSSCGVAKGSGYDFETT